MTDSFNITIRGLILGCLCLFFIGLTACNSREGTRTAIETLEIASAPENQSDAAPESTQSAASRAETGTDSQSVIAENTAAVPPSESAKNVRNSDGTASNIPATGETVFVEKMRFEGQSLNLHRLQKQEVESKLNGAGPVTEVQVLVWAEGAGSAKDIKLANERAEVMKNYLKEGLKVSNVKVANLTENPSLREEMYSSLRPSAEALRVELSRIGVNRSSELSSEHLKSPGIIVIYRK